jgi:LPPG:FO 2-phospho-L-lactate transferase
MSAKHRIIALSGGVGGAKLAQGLDMLDDINLTIVVNTGDDFEHLGLMISPDIDSVVYALAGLSDVDRGWGRADESWHFMEETQRLGGDDWFLLGDRDLAMHIARTNAIRGGEPLSSFTTRIAQRLGIRAQIVPMTDDAVRTIITSDEGRLAFQRYFVSRRCEPVVRSIDFEGAPSARPAAELETTFADPGPDAVIICPSNPYLSIDPILSIPGIAGILSASRAPVVAVSPIVGGQAIKGPTAKIMNELGLAVTNDTIASHYGDLIDGIVIDHGDRRPVAASPLAYLSVPTLMHAIDDKVRLARQTVDFALSLSHSERVGWRG